MSPATCNGHAVRASPQTQTRRRLWLISRDIGSRSFQTRYVLRTRLDTKDLTSSVAYWVDLMFDGV
ncbi:hypothetical protein Hanom_Chr12g01111711 [Helianthus anomalus]